MGEYANLNLANGDRGSWMQTYTGARFYPLSPEPSEVDPLDIAHALSRICRYGGHTLRHYSVAEHCLLMSHAVAPEHALWALLHDATEAYVGDMVRPLKHHMPDYRAAEDRVMLAIALRFGLPVNYDEHGPNFGGQVRAYAPMPPEVKDADNRILINERAAVMRPTSEQWACDGLQPLNVEIRCYPAEKIKTLYLLRLQSLLSAAGVCDATEAVDRALERIGV